MSFHFKTLEFDIILEEISSYAHSLSTTTKIKELSPLFDADFIKEQHLKISEAMQILIKSGKLPFLNDFDIKEILNMLKQERELNISDLQYIRLFSVMSNQFILKSKSFAKDKIALEHLNYYFESLYIFEDVVALIDQSIDYDGFVKDSASEGLFQIRRAKQRALKRRDEVLQQALTKRKSILNDSILLLRNDRYCLPVKTEHKNQVKGIIHDVSASGTTTYIEPLEASVYSNELTVLHKEEEQEISKILSLIAAELYPRYEEFLANLKIMIELDFLFAAASYSIKYNCNMPQVNNSGDVYLKNARHPLIPQDEVVPVTIKISETKPVLLITGPNTGGKTVGLKTLGLLSIMAQSGLLIPVDTPSSVSIFSGIYADIGDHQSIKQSLSTFSSHIKNINSILQNVKPMSLILIDELGSGTDPNEGVSLAKAIINYLMKKDSRLVVTTHYSELKVFAYSNPTIENASVRFDEKTLKPLFIIDYGKSGSSNAIKIAKRLGVTDEIITEAIGYLTETQTNLDASIQAFEEKHEQLQERLESIMVKENKLILQNKTLEDKLSQIEREKDQILLKAQDEAKKEIENIKKDAQKILESLKTSKTEHEVASLKYDLRQLGITTPQEQSDETFKIGDTVFIKSYRQTGKVIDIKNDEYIVKFGIFELAFDGSNLTKTTQREKRTTTIKKEVTQQKSYVHATTELDLRGFRYEEVEKAYKDFIDQALLGKLKELRIIHGFGTGAVRKALYEELKHDNHVKSYRFGGEHEGLNGVTIVTLKE